jgi:hypothetical protein
MGKTHDGVKMIDFDSARTTGAMKAATAFNCGTRILRVIFTEATPVRFFQTAFSSPDTKRPKPGGSQFWQENELFGELRQLTTRLCKLTKAPSKVLEGFVNLHSA